MSHYYEERVSWYREINASTSRIDNPFWEPISGIEMEKLLGDAFLSLEYEGERYYFKMDSNKILAKSKRSLNGFSMYFKAVYNEGSSLRFGSKWSSRTSN